MSEEGADKRAEMLERARKAGGGTAEDTGVARQADTAREGHAGGGAPMLMEEVCARENLLAAHRRVVLNGGAAGDDRMNVEELMPYCRQHWARIREELLSGTYMPQAVRRVEIPKPEGKGKGMPGISTVLDRLIQQALLQILTPIFNSRFSEDRYGFRPGRSAHDALRSAREQMVAGYRWVVDLEIEKLPSTG